MLFALDIDGTIATSGNWFAQWMTKEAGIAVPEDELARVQYGVEWWQLPAIRALSHERRAELRTHAHAHHKDLDHLANSVPIPGAREALQWLLDEESGSRIIYTTCRPGAGQQITRAWLERYGFPSSENVYTCERYHSKFIHAHSQAGAKEPVVLIDDQIEKMVPAFRALVKHDRDLGLSLILRLALVQIGRREPPTFPFPVPFPVLACPSWARDDMEWMIHQGRNGLHHGASRTAF